MMLCASVLASACATPAGGNYCQIAQRPFEWRSDAEIDATPIRPMRWIEVEAATWARVCGQG